jgi:DNA-binding CsgD family transcriptional regulator/PAS domain-containing protein
MHDEAELSELIGEIYDAALDPTTWANVVKRVVIFWKGQAGCLIGTDVAKRNSRIEHGFGLPEFFQRSSLERYFRLPPLRAALASGTIGEPIRIHDLATKADVDRRRFRRRAMTPLGWSELIFVPVSRGFENSTAIAMACRDRWSYDRDRIRILCPHLEQSLRIGRSLKTKQSQTAGFGATLDGLKPGVFLLNEKGRIVQANSSAQSMLREGDILHTANGELSFRDSHADQQIKAAIAAGWGASGVSIQTTSKVGDRYTGRLLLLSEGRQYRGAGGFTAVLALFVYKTEFETAPPLKLIAEAYNLTPAEMRVFLAVVQIGGVPEAAETLGIARNTARVLLQRVYNKTGVGRQAELAKLLASFSTPLTS